MALRRDTARNLRRAFHDERAFVAAVAAEIESRRIKRQMGEKLIINWHQHRFKLEQMLAVALRDEWEP